MHLASTLRVPTIVASLIPLLLAAGPVDKPAPPATQPASKDAISAAKSPVFDDLDQFKRIVIIWETSGSVLNELPALKYQLNSAVAGMSADQSFNLISLQDKSFESVAKDMLPATAGSKENAAAFLRELTGTGTTDPMPGIEEAFREQPDVIYLLDNGDYPDNAAVAKRIGELNKNNKTRIYTIAFQNPGDNDLDFVAFFQKLAGDGNGKFKRINGDSLSIPAFKSELFDDLQHFRRVVFVCDACGSMINKMDKLKDQLNKAVDSFGTGQSFNIIFFQDKTLSSVAKELLPASAENKEKAANFIEDFYTTGTTDPIPGIQFAFREKPDVIYLLGDGEFADNDSVFKTFHDLNGEKKVKVYSVLFTESDGSPEDIAVYKRIAGEGNGKFKHVDAKKLPTPVFKSRLFEDLNQYHRLLFLNDGSGSMLNKMATLKIELGKAFMSLSAEQEFNAVFFKGRTARGDWFKKDPAAATAEMKNKAMTYLEGTSARMSDPFCCLDEAFRQKSDVIYLLTDGDFPDNDAVLKKIRELNKDKAVKIYTVAFVGSTDTDTAFIDVLKTIARESGGKFRLVKEEAL